MPPSIRFTREDIANAAFGLVRERGHECLNARTLAAALGCSTQPLLYQFDSVDDIRRAAYAVADGFHSAFLMDGLDAAEDPLLALGLNYVRFGHEEPRLFRFLFQTDGLGAQDMGALLEDPALEEMLALVSTEAGLGRDEARAVFLSLFISAHGYASLLANNAIDFDEGLVTTALTSAYMGALAQLKEEDHETAR